MKEPFKINIPDVAIEDLKNRLGKTRWTNDPEPSAWEAGTSKRYLEALCTYWEKEYDWKKQQEHLNSFSHYTSEIDGAKLHFIHEKGKGSRSVPLLLIHGFPDSFVRFLKVIPLLTQADGDGFSFDLVIPSIPGYGFSGIPDKQGMNPKRIAELFTQLMSELQYDTFYAQGGDWGSSITEQIALNYPDKLAGMHLTDIPYYHLFAVPEGELTDAEKNYLAAGKKWQMTEGGYAILQSTKPQTLGYGLNDSPAALAAWIIEKFHRWSDCHDNLDNSYTKDELLTNLSIYWYTQTINSAIRIYYETARMDRSDSSIKLKTPTAIAIFPKDIIPAPKEYAERIYALKQFNEMPAGGHFAAMEQPELLSKDIREFVKQNLPK